jgi:peptide/nickel transport system permease protein
LTVSTTSSAPVPPGLVVAPQLPDLLLPVAIRRGVLGFLRNHPTVAIGGALLLCLVVIAIFAPWLGTVDPTALAPAKRTRPPSADFWFGTDALGHDLYSRVLYGARVSLTVGLSVAVLASLAGLAIGLVSGFVRWADGIIMRIMDGLASFPPLVLALAVVGILGPGLENAVLAIAIVVIPGFARLIRAQTLAVRQETFIEASRSMGTKPGRVRRKRVLPNVASPLIVGVSLAIGGALIAEASLSLLGFGATPGEPSWGSMIQQGRSFVYNHPWQVFVPSIALALTILAFNTFGDGIRDALENVKGLYLNNGLLTNSPTEHAGYDPSGQFVMTVRDGAFHLVK